MRSSERPRLSLLLTVLLCLCVVFWPRLIRAQDLEPVDGDFGLVSLEPVPDTAADDSFTTSRKLLSGWAWSSNIGWISFGELSKNKGYQTYNSVNNGVYLQPSNGSGLRYFGGRTDGSPGYAWSPAIGWIQFDPQLAWKASAYNNSFPNSSDNYGVRLYKNTNTITGWARACAVFEQEAACAGPLKADKYRGGWDGWIKFSGETADGHTYESALVDEPVPGPATIGNPYVVDGNPVSFSDSYAWGGNLLGWMNWHAAGNEYGVDLLGVQAVCRLGPSFTGTTKTLNLQSGQTMNVDWKVTGNSAKSDGKYTFNWIWKRGGNDSGGDSYNGANNNFTSTRSYVCGAGASTSVLEEGYASVTDPNGQNNACTASVRINCNYIPDNNGDSAVLTSPTASLIAISSQPLGLPAISSGTSFHNVGGDTTLTIKSSRSLVDPSHSLSDFSAVKCRLAGSSFGNNGNKSDFGACNTGNELATSSGADTFFNIAVDPNPPAELNLYSPYQIVIGSPDGEGGVVFTFEYGVGTIKQS